MIGWVDDRQRRPSAGICGSPCLSSGKAILGRAIEGTEARLGRSEPESFCPEWFCLAAVSVWSAGSGPVAISA
jgi:hypothetical protein